MRCLWAGRERAKRLFFNRLGQFGVDILHVIAQQHGVGDETQILAHLAADQVVVSPVRIFTATPCLSGLSMAVAAVGLGGSRKATYLSERDRVRRLGAGLLSRQS